MLILGSNIAQVPKAALETENLTAFRQKAASADLLLVVDSLPDFRGWLQRSGISTKQIRWYPGHNACLIRLSPKDYARLAEGYPGLRYADIRDRIPKQEAPQSRYDQTLNRLNVVRDHFPGLTGFTEVLALKEPRFDTADLDIRSRYVTSGLETGDNDQEFLPYLPVVTPLSQEGEQLVGRIPYRIPVQGQSGTGILLNTVPVAVLKADLCPFGDALEQVVIL